jgi:hypothetical protein
MVNKRKSYYTGGLISLILLPILCIGYFQNSKIFEEYYAFDVARYNDEWFKDNGFLKTDLLLIRKFRIIELNGDDAKTKTQFDKVRYELKEIIAKSDTINGLIIRFSDNTKYSSFVKALEICRTEDLRSYLYYDDLYVFQTLPTKNVAEDVPVFICGNTRYKTELKADKSLLQILNSNPRFWLILIALLFFSFLSNYKIYEKGNR